LPSTSQIFLFYLQGKIFCLSLLVEELSVKIVRNITKISRFKLFKFSQFHQNSLKFQRVKMKLLVAFVLIAISCVTCEIEPECIQKFLNRDASMPETCNNEFKKLFKNFMSFFEDKGDSRIHKCIISNIDDYKLISLYLKGLHNHLENKTDDELYDYEFKKSQKYFLEKLRVLCTDDAAYSLYAAYYRRSATKKNSHKNLCKQKYLIEQNIINVTDYSIDASVYEVKDCDNIIKEFSTFWNNFKNTKFNVFDIKEGEAINKCIYEKLFPAKVYLYKEAFDIIATFELSEEQRKDLETKFVDWSVKMADLELSCFQTVL
jgi:hypothetical protein